MPDLGRLLIVEDTPSLARTYEAHLRGEFAETVIAPTGADARHAYGSNRPDCILLDLKLPDTDGMELLRSWLAEEIRVPIIVITANGSMTAAIDAMRAGANDFLVKPISRERLVGSVHEVMKGAALPPAARPATAARSRPNKSVLGQFVGDSLPMQVVYRTLEAAAPSRAHVFITGETGTGKEVAARTLHEISPRRSNAFVPVNCGAIPRELIESELFGHVRGAFTGATTDRVGAVQVANGGTLFLDELGEMPIELQPKLLRFIQTGDYSRVGESTLQNANIRIVAATNRDPLLAVREGRLREDLYYRLHVIPVILPPLRNRGVDILHLARTFLERFAAEENKTFDRFDRTAEEWLVGRRWPGNVRQLENLIRQLTVLVPGGTITAEHLMAHEPRGAIISPPTAEPIRADNDVPAGIEPLWLTEKNAIERAIALCEGSVPRAAKELEVSPSTLYRKRAAWMSPGELKAG